MTPMRIAEHWSEYARQVLPETAGMTQRVETRRAFYAGARALLKTLEEVSGLSEEQGVEILEQLEGECDDFLEDLKQGRA